MGPLCWSIVSLAASVVQDMPPDRAKEIAEKFEQIIAAVAKAEGED